jgi:Transcription factor Pcc1
LVDSPPYVRLEVDGSDLVVRTTATSARSVRATFEDLLACVQVAERTARSAAGSK